MAMSIWFSSIIFIYAIISLVGWKHIDIVLPEDTATNFIDGLVISSLAVMAICTLGLFVSHIISSVFSNNQRKQKKDKCNKRMALILAGFSIVYFVGTIL
eukprot:244188_1